MKVSFTFSKYIAKMFLQWFFIVVFTFSTIISLFNVVELLRRAQNKPNVGLTQVILMALYQLPELLNQLMPFMMLFATMLLFWHMNRRLELVVGRSLGLSIWSVLMPVWATIFSFSLLNFALLNPISAEFSTRFEDMEKDLLTRRSNYLMVSRSGLWLKQEEASNYSLVRVARIDQHSDNLQGVTVYTFDDKNQFVNRLDADNVTLNAQGWLLKDAVLSEFNKASQKMGDSLWKTDLTIHKIQESFSSPDSISVWRLPGFIRLMEGAGLSSLEHVQHFYKQLLMPFLFLTMATIAGICAYHFNRRQGGMYFVITGLGAGFFVFFLHKVSHAMGLSMTIPLFLSVLVPVLIGVLGSISLLLHLEES